MLEMEGNESLLGMTTGWGEVGRPASVPTLLKISFLFPNKFGRVGMENLHVQNEEIISTSFTIYLFYNRYRLLISIN